MDQGELMNDTPKLICSRCGGPERGGYYEWNIIKPENYVCGKCYEENLGRTFSQFASDLIQMAKDVAKK